MAGFNLFNQTTTASATPGSPFGTTGLNTSATFGSTPNQQNVSFGATATSPGNFTFGASASQPSFSTVKPLSFGTPGSSIFGTPSTTAAQPSLSFGSNTMLGSTTTATSTLVKPAFGTSSFSTPMTTQSGLSFGAAVTTTSTGLGFGAAASPQTGLSFGTPATTQAGISFGTPATTQAGISFGTPATTAQTGISFGVPASTTQAGISFGAQPSAATTGLSQASTLTTGTAASTTPGLKLSFSGTSTPSFFSGTNTTQATPFGGTSTSQSLSSSGISTSQPLSFSVTSASQPLSFGTGSPSTTTSQSVLGSLSASSTTTSAPSLFGNLTVASSAATATTSSSSFFGTSSTSTSTTTSTSGIFSWQKPASETPVTSTASVGLGGVDHTAVTAAQSSSNTSVSVKEQPLPSEIQQTVVTFKEYVKTQKNLSSEVARLSSEPLSKLSQQIAGLNNLILSLGSVLSQQKFSAERIKVETIKALNDYELAQKIKDSPVASEERMLSIRRYFIEKISAFEESTKVLQEKIEYVYQHVITLPQENSLSADALKLIIKKLHDSFVVICARAYKLHNDMQLLKVQYLTLRNHFVKDNSSISFSMNREIQLPQETTRMKPSSDISLEGPNPFSRTGNGSFNSLLLTSQNRNFPVTTTSSSMSGLLNMSKSFGFSDVPSASIFDQSSTSGQQFNLQKPPLGNKRRVM